jgi:hypothetical protein
MKSSKMYLVVVTVILVIGIGLGVYVWYTLQTLSTEVPQAKNVSELKNEKNEEETLPTEPTTIQTDALPPSQQKILDGFGYEGETITITPAMFACAEKSLTKERINEILGGSAHTPFESISLLPCFKK